MCYTKYRQLKVHEDLGTYFSAQYLISVDWIGDSPQQVAEFRDQWLKVVDNLAPGVRFNDLMLRDILFGKMEKTGSTVTENDVAHFRRDTQDHTYLFLWTRWTGTWRTGPWSKAVRFKRATTYGT